MSTHPSSLLAALALGFCLLHSGCKAPSSTPTPSKSPHPVQRGPILAKVGQRSIGLKEFRALYQKHGRGQSPKAFLDALLQEQMLLQEARKARLQATARLRRVLRKSLAHSILKYGFEKWYHRESISTMELQAEYRKYKYVFNRPPQLLAWHILARFPKAYYTPGPKVAPELREAKARARKALEERVKALADRALALVLQAQPTTGLEFAEAARDLQKSVNLQNPKLLAWGAEFKKAFLPAVNQPGRQLAKIIRPFSRKLDAFFFCDTCDFLKKHIDAHVLKWRTLKAPISKKGIEWFWKGIKFGYTQPLDALRIKRLKPFFHFQMVPPFSKAAFALKDLSYTKNLVRTKFGYHIIFRIRSFKGENIPKKRAFNMLRNRLHYLRQPKMYRRWLLSIKKKHKIIRYNDRLLELQKRHQSGSKKASKRRPPKQR